MLESTPVMEQSIKKIEDITCPRVDTNFIFKCSTREDKICIHKRARTCNILFIIQTPMKYQENDLLD